MLKTIGYSEQIILQMIKVVNNKEAKKKTSGAYEL